MHAPSVVAFERAPYRAQIFRLRKIVDLALKQYSIKVANVKFINHGENTTYCVTAKSGKKFLLRIHRNGYHTEPALLEELKWLERLTEEGVSCPSPLRSKTGKPFVKVQHPLVGLRRCTLLKWTDGTFFQENLNVKRCFNWGKLVAQLQCHGQFKVTHRRYWDADGLLSTNSRFGSVEGVEGISSKQQKVLSHARRVLHKRIKAYEKKFGDRAGLIHADLHRGNFVQTRDGLAAIDFDDCGYGFHIYDLAVPFLSVVFLSKEMKKNNFEELKSALIEGYKSVRGFWDHYDEEMLWTFTATRLVVMVGWINSRRDNPKIANRVRERTELAISFLSDYKII